MNIISDIAGKLNDPVYRTAFVASQINIGIPFQIRALMKSRNWTQAQLAEKTDMLQPRISGLMTPGKTRPNIETLRRVAEAFDCALIVRFAPFSELTRWSERFDPDSFSVPEFTNDKGFDETEQKTAKEVTPGVSLQYLASVADNTDTAAWAELLREASKFTFPQSESPTRFTLKQMATANEPIREQQPLNPQTVTRIDTSPLFIAKTPLDRKYPGVEYNNLNQIEQRAMSL